MTFWYKPSCDEDKFFMRIRTLLTLTEERELDKFQIGVNLVELNVLNYKNLPVNHSYFYLLINCMCNNIQVWDTNLVKMYCKLLAVAARNDLKLEDRTMLACRNWLYQAIQFSELSAKHLALIALRDLVKKSSFISTTEDAEILIGERGIFCKLLRSSTDETKYLIMQCLEILISVKEKQKGILRSKSLRKIRQLACDELNSPPKGETNLLHYKMICCCLRIVTSLIDQKLNEKSSEINGEILGIVQTYLFMGITNYPVIEPTILKPAVMDLPERIHIPPKGKNTRPITKGKAKKSSKKSSKDKQNGNSSGNAVNLQKKFAKSSDSEASDTDKGCQSKLSSQVRSHALKILHEIIKEIPSKEIFGFWSQIITNAGDHSHPRVLLKFILVEPICKIRQIALSVLTDAIIDARMFLIHADETEHPSFITIFGTVGAMLEEIHLTLALFLSSERNFTALTQALKCSASLIQVTPYRRLKRGLASKLARHSRAFLLHKDPTVRVVALSVFEAFANVEDMNKEIQKILYKKSRHTNLLQHMKKLSSLSETDDNLAIQKLVADFEEIDTCDLEAWQNGEVSREESAKPENENKSSFLVQICLNNIEDQKMNVPVRLQSFKLLGALITTMETNICNYFDVVMITQHLINASKESDPQVSLHACRVIETISSKLSESKAEHDMLRFWNNIFDVILTQLQSPETILREVAYDCFGTISNDVFSHLSADKAIIIKTTLFTACKDDESAVRAAGLRSLGMLINLPSVEEDTGFIEDLVDVVCKSLSDDNLGVRVKGAWALANLTDCLIKQDNNDGIGLMPLKIILLTLYNSSIKAAKDNNKVKCNGLRAVGNTLHLCRGRNILGNVSDALDVLITSATQGNDMKVRWNACRALGFAIAADPDELFPQDWRDGVIPPLCDLICNSPNFKVRTNAAWALASCKSYGKYVPFLWKSIAIALENSQHVPNFVEYTHRDSLLQQLCLTLGHVAARTDPADLQILWPDIKDHAKDIEMHMKYFQEQVLPEKTDDFIGARLILKNYAQTMSLHSNERFIADALANLFSTQSFYDELENTVLTN